MKQLLSSPIALLSRRGYRLALLALVTVALLTATGNWLFSTAQAHAAPSEHHVWCGDWDPNPANTTDKQIVPGTIKSPQKDGSVVEFDEGYYQGTLYIWVNLANAPVGDQVALIWEYAKNDGWYQCGDAHGYNAATVYAGSSDTWTAGVPASQIGYYDIEIGFWPS
jgi:hypothetical protein